MSIWQAFTRSITSSLNVVAEAAEAAETSMKGLNAASEICVISAENMIKQARKEYEELDKIQDADKDHARNLAQAKHDAKKRSVKEAAKTV